jgi:hypothetical protein
MQRDVNAVTALVIGRRYQLVEDEQGVDGCSSRGLSTGG